MIFGTTVIQNIQKKNNNISVLEKRPRKTN